MVLLLSLFFSLNISAQTQFETSYASFTLPNDWACQANGQDWICRSKDPTASKRGFILLKAKLLAPGESASSYLSTLSRPISRQQSDKTLSLSKVISATEKPIQGKAWIQAQHLDSEIKNYYTKYLITTQGDIAVLAQFNWHKDAKYPFQTMYKGMINTLKIKKNIASAQALPTPSTTGLIPEMELLEENITWLDIFMSYYTKYRYQVSAIALALVMLPLIAIFYSRKK